jgi:hypothetical protein
MGKNKMKRVQPSDSKETSGQGKGPVHPRAKERSVNDNETARMGGHSAVPYEQNTQQSPSSGFSRSPHPLQL